MIKRILDSYYFNYLRYLLNGKQMEPLITFYRRKGVKIGAHCRLFSPPLSAEPYLIEIGDNVTVAVGVKFITHDNSISKIFSDKTDVFGKIIIGENVFVGAYSLILPGVSIGSNSIIGAGSVVTKSFGDNLIIAGNPARVISTVDSYKEKVISLSQNMRNLSDEERKNKILRGPLLLN